MKFLIIISLLILGLGYQGCGIIIPLTNNKDKLNQLELDMKKGEVIKVIGDPDEIRGSVKNVDGDIVTVWQYELYNKSSALTNFGLGIFPFFTLTWWVPTLGAYNTPDTYWLYMINESLVQWGRAGDWRPDQIMDITIRNK